jgi:hypothetical protein
LLSSLAVIIYEKKGDVFDKENKMRPKMHSMSYSLSLAFCSLAMTRKYKIGFVPFWVIPIGYLIYDMGRVNC